MSSEINGKMAQKHAQSLVDHLDEIPEEEWETNRGHVMQHISELADDFISTAEAFGKLTDEIEKRFGSE